MLYLNSFVPLFVLDLFDAPTSFPFSQHPLLFQEPTQNARIKFNILQPTKYMFSQY